MAVIDKSESLRFVYELYEKMKKNKVNLAYEGEITHQITKAFTSLTENNMAKEEDDNSVQKKVFHVMVECLQNISKHADRPEEENKSKDKDGRGLFLVSKCEEEYNVTTGNVIKNDKIPFLREMLDGINSLDREGLKNKYKQQIKSRPPGELTEAGGAGLGFIDIARKTGRKLIFDFLPLDEENSFFILISTISRKKETE